MSHVVFIASDIDYVMPDEQHSTSADPSKDPTYDPYYFKEDIGMFA